MEILYGGLAMMLRRHVHVTHFVLAVLILVQTSGCDCLPRVTKLVLLLSSLSLSRCNSFPKSVYCLLSGSLSPFSSFSLLPFFSSCLASVRGAPPLSPEIATGRSPISTASIAALFSSRNAPIPRSAVIPVASPLFVVSGGLTSVFSGVSSTLPARDLAPSRFSQQKEEVDHGAPWLSSGYALLPVSTSPGSPSRDVVGKNNDDDRSPETVREGSHDALQLSDTGLGSLAFPSASFPRPTPLSSALFTSFPAQSKAPASGSAGPTPPTPGGLEVTTRDSVRSASALIRLPPGSRADSVRSSDVSEGLPFSDPPLHSSRPPAGPEKTQGTLWDLTQRASEANASRNAYTRFVPGTLRRGLSSSETSGEEGLTLARPNEATSGQRVKVLDTGKGGQSAETVRGLIDTPGEGESVVIVRDEQRREDTSFLLPSSGDNSNNRGVSFGTHLGTKSNEKNGGLRKADYPPRSQGVPLDDYGDDHGIDGYIDAVDGVGKRKGGFQESAVSVPNEDAKGSVARISTFSETANEGARASGTLLQPLGHKTTPQAPSGGDSKAASKERTLFVTVVSAVATRDEGESSLEDSQVPSLLKGSKVLRDSEPSEGSSPPRVLNDESVSVAESPPSTRVVVSSSSPEDTGDSPASGEDTPRRLQKSSPHSVDSSSGSVKSIQEEASASAVVAGDSAGPRGCADSGVAESCHGSQEEGGGGKTRRDGDQVVHSLEDKDILGVEKEDKEVKLVNSGTSSGEGTKEQRSAVEKDQGGEVNDETAQKGESKDEGTSQGGPVKTNDTGQGNFGKEDSAQDQNGLPISQPTGQASDTLEGTRSAPSTVDRAEEIPKEAGEEGTGFSVIQRTATLGGEDAFSAEQTAFADAISSGDGGGDTDQPGASAGLAGEQKDKVESTESVLFPPVNEGKKKKRGFTRGGRYLGSPAYSYFPSLSWSSGSPPHPLLVSLLYSQPDNRHHALVTDNDRRLLDEEEQVFLTVEGAAEDAGDSFVRGKQTDAGGEPEVLSSAVRASSTQNQGKTTPPWGLHFAETFEGQMMCFQWNVFNGAFSLALAYLCSPLYRHAVFATQQSARGVYRPPPSPRPSEDSSFTNNIHTGSRSTLPFSWVTRLLSWTASWVSSQLQSAFRSLTVKWVRDYVPVPLLPSLLPTGSLSGIQHPSTSLSSGDFEDPSPSGDEVFSSAVFRSSAAAAPAFSTPGFFSSSFGTSTSFSSCCGDLPVTALNGENRRQMRFPSVADGYGSEAAPRETQDYASPRPLLNSPLFFQATGVMGRVPGGAGADSSNAPLRSAWRLACMSAQALQSSSAVLQSFGCTYTSPASTTVGWLLATLSMASSFMHPMLSLFSNCVSAAYDVYALVW